MPSSTAVFTICSNNYLPQAGVFLASVREHLPDADLFLGLADVSDGDPQGFEDVEIIQADRLDIPDFHRVAFGYDIMEFNTAIKPFMFMRLFERGYQRILYFDPDILLFNDLAGVFKSLDEGSSFVLTPHLCSPPGVDAPRTERHVMQTGIFNLGFLACSAQPETETILRWWARKLRHECIDDQGSGLFVDQKFMDLVPGFANSARILRDTSANVAYWNLAQRRLEQGASGWTVDGVPLGFFHFSGFDPRQPTRLSKHIDPAPLPDALLNLLADYARLLAASVPRRASPYAYASFASGLTIPKIARAMYREHQPVWSGDPFKTYEAYLRLPSPHAILGESGAVVTNLMERVHARSNEARYRFDLRDRRDVLLFTRWLKQKAADYGVGSLLP